MTYGYNIERDNVVFTPFLTVGVTSDLILKAAKGIAFDGHEFTLATASSKKRTRVFATTGINIVGNVVDFGINVSGFRASKFKGFAGAVKLAVKF
jgi:hypothetical protein